MIKSKILKLEPRRKIFIDIMIDECLKIWKNGVISTMMEKVDLEN